LNNQETEKKKPIGAFVSLALLALIAGCGRYAFTVVSTGAVRAHDDDVLHEWRMERI